MSVSSPLLLRSLRPPAPFLVAVTVALLARFHGTEIVRFAPFALVFLFAEAGGFAAKMMRTEPDALEVEYGLLVVRRIRYSAIAGVELRRTMFGLLTRVRIFRNDGGFVIEMDAPTADAERFARDLALRLNIGGAPQSRSFQRPLAQRLVDVLPIALGALAPLAFRWPVHAFGLVVGVILMLAWTAYSWRGPRASASR